MKRVFSVCLALMLLAGCLSVQGAAEESTITNSVDIVVLVDMSKSMKTTNGGSDPNVYRLDAAEMLVAMCDANSRVLYVPFGDSVLTGLRGGRLRADTDFQDISSYEIRKEYMERIEQDKTEIVNDPEYVLRADTDYGEALRYAVEKINSRGPDEHNQPMIVLLTDGANYFSAGAAQNLANRYSYLWDADARQWKRASQPGYSAAAADQLAAAATAACVQLGIPVYTISLTDVRATGQEQINQERASQQLAAISADTQGDSKIVSSSNADELPAFFGQVFADRIGGSMQRNLRLQSDGDESYVNIPILNSSIREVNILLPMKNVDRDSIVFTDGGGSVVDLDSRQDVTVLFGAKNSPFWLFKITEPRSLGVWNLRFRMTGGTASGTKVSLGVVFNYNLTLQTRIGKNENDLTGGDTLSLSKNADLYVESLFIDNRTELPTDDLALYQRIENAEEDWWEIRAACSLYREGETAPVSQRLANFSIDSDGTRFFARVPLLAGGAGLEAGNYELRVKVEGAGLSREVVRHLILTNSDPVATNYTETHYVDYASADHLPQGAQTDTNIKIRLNGLIFDEDGDKLELSLLPPREGAELLLNPRITEDGSDRYFEAAIAGAPGSYAFGTSRQVIHVTDLQGEGVDMEVTVQAVSGIETARASDFTAYLVTNGATQNRQPLDGEGAQASVGKKIDVTQWVQYRPANGDTTVQLDDFDIVLTRTNDQDAQVDQPQTLAKEGQAQRVTYTTPENEGLWNARWTVYYLGQPIKTYAYSVKIENQKPFLKDDLGEEVEQQITFNQLPSFLGFLNAVEGNTPEEELTVSLKKVFGDYDDELKYAVSYEDGVLAEEAAVLHNDPNQENHLLKIIPRAEGSVRLTVTARDNDGETVKRTYRFQVKDLTRMWVIRGLIALAALAALTVLILIIRQIRKPVFKSVRLGIREGASLYNSMEYDLPPTKKAWPMSYVVDTGMAAKFGIPDVTLQNLIMEPTRSQDGTIKVSSRRAVGSVEVTLEGNPVGRHAVRWSPGQALELRPTPNAHEFLRIVLSLGDGGADYVQSAGVDDFSFGGDGEFSGNFGVPDGFDIHSAGTFGASGGFGAPGDGGFGAPADKDFGQDGNGGDPFDFGAPTPPSGSDF